MQIFDYSPNAGQPATQGTLKRFGQFLKYGSDGKAEMEAQGKLQALLSKYLDDRYCLLRCISLPDLEVPIPFILIGPPGIQMIYVTPVHGIYRARGDTWEMVDSHRRFRPASPNLLIRANLMARAIEVYLERRGAVQVKVNPVLVSTESGLYVETIRPTVRIVMSDAIERYIAGLQQDQLVITRPDVEALVDILTTRQEASAAQAEPAAVPQEVYVPEVPAEETPAWVDDRIAALEETPEVDADEEPAEALPDESALSEPKAEWVAEETLLQPEAPVSDAVTADEAAEEVVAENPLLAALTRPSPEGEAADAAAVEETATVAAPRRGLLSAFTRQQTTILAIMVVLILVVVAAFVFLLLTNS